MSIKTVKTEELRRMNGKEGLILQGCGGDPQEWLDGINGLFTDEGILKNGSRFENISVFQNGELTNILFPFEDSVEIDMGKLSPCGACVPMSSSAAHGCRTMCRTSSAGLLTKPRPNRKSPTAGSSVRTETSSTLWGLPPVHSAITDLRNRQRK